MINHSSVLSSPTNIPQKASVAWSVQFPPTRLKAHDEVLPGGVAKIYYSQPLNYSTQPEKFPTTNKIVHLVDTLGTNEDRS